MGHQPACRAEGNSLPTDQIGVIPYSVEHHPHILSRSRLGGLLEVLHPERALTLAQSPKGPIRPRTATKPTEATLGRGSTSLI